jgi:hypothetical protein
VRLNCDAFVPLWNVREVHKLCSVIL